MQIEAQRQGRTILSASADNIRTLGINGIAVYAVRGILSADIILTLDSVTSFLGSYRLRFGDIRRIEQSRFWVRSMWFESTPLTAPAARKRVYRHLLSLSLPEAAAQAAIDAMSDDVALTAASGLNVTVQSESYIVGYGDNVEDTLYFGTRFGAEPTAKQLSGLASKSLRERATFLAERRAKEREVAAAIAGGGDKVVIVAAEVAAESAPKVAEVDK